MGCEAQLDHSRPPQNDHLLTRRHRLLCVVELRQPRCGFGLLAPDQSPARRCQELPAPATAKQPTCWRVMGPDQAGAPFYAPQQSRARRNLQLNLGSRHRDIGRDGDLDGRVQINIDVDRFCDLDRHDQAVADFHRVSPGFFPPSAHRKDRDM